MVKKNIFVFLSLLITLNIYANITKEEVLYRQANRYNYKREYEKANSIYKKLFSSKRYSNLAFEKYFYNLLKLKKEEAAKKSLEEQKNNLSKELYNKLKIYFLLYKGEFNEAEKLATDLLARQKNPASFIKIADIFSVFARYDFAINLYLKGRKLLKNENLFAFNLAYLYKRNKNYKKAVLEMINNLKQNKNNYNLAQSFILNLVEEDKSVIKLLNRQTPAGLKTIYILALIKAGFKEKAIENAKSLSQNELKKVIEFVKNENYIIALNLLKIYYDKSQTAPQKIETKLEMARIYLDKQDITNAKELLMQIYNDEKIQSNYFKRKTKANFECRKLLAKITLMENKDLNRAIKYLKEARKFTFNKKEKAEIDLKLLYLTILTSSFKESKKALNNLAVTNEKSDDFIYYKYLIYALNKNKKADTLLVDLIIKMPESNFTNDALTLNYFLSLADDNSKEYFIKAFKEKKLYRFSEAHIQLEQCYKATHKEEFLLLSVIWYIQENNPVPSRYFQIEYKDKFVKDFIDYLQIIKSEENFKEKAIAYLSKNPSSIFSPQLRRRLGVIE